MYLGFNSKGDETEGIFKYLLIMNRRNPTKLRVAANRDKTANRRTWINWPDDLVYSAMFLYALAAS